MKNFEIAFRSLFKRGRSNVIKILALTIGLTMGLILIAKVCYESSFESFYPDYERIYLVHETLIRDGELMSYGQISGGVIPKLEAEIPEIEEATRITYAGHLGSVFKTSDQKSYSANGYLVDTTFFDVLPRNILIGNPKEILANPEDVMISEKLALTLGGIDQALGQDIIFDAYPDRKFHIAGVFEDVPENTVLKYDMLFSIYLQGEWSLSNWLGNDCYQGLVKLNPQTDYKMLDPALREVQTRHADMQLMADAGVDLRYTLEPFIGQHSQNEEVRSMNRLLLILAVILIFATVMNYILIVISTLINRTKEVAVYKCYGASTRNLLGLTFTESLILIVLALIFGLFIILLFRSRIESLLDASLGALFTLQTMSVLAWICVLVFLITAFIPAYLYLHVPVAAAFRNYKESRRYWKLALLFVQFVATAYFVSILFIVNRQYHHLINTDLGYSYDKLYYTNLTNIDPSFRNALDNELKKLPQVKRFSSAFTLPCEHSSGNIIYLLVRM